MTLIQIISGLILCAVCYYAGRGHGKKLFFDIKRDKMTLHEYVEKIAQDSRDAIQRGEARRVLQSLEN